MNETHVCVYVCERVNKTGGLVRRVQAASFQQLLAFPADLALNSLNLPAESRNWATRGILCETAKHREDEYMVEGEKKKKQPGRQNEGGADEREKQKEEGWDG